MIKHSAKSMGKRAYLLKILQDIRASYWFLPTVLVFVGLGLASAMGWVDGHAAQLPLQLPESLTDTQPAGARSTLAVIAQAIIGVTGVTFSMTLVAVSFASGNFGPRLIGNFMRDRGNQWSLGILIATFVYALAVLRTVQEGGADVAEYVPHYSLVVALGLTLLCVFTLIYFIHHVPETINVSRISAGIGTALEQQIRALIDDRDGEVRNDQDAAPPKRTPDAVIRARVSGYIQTVNFSRLSRLAEKNDWFISLDAPVGSFLTTETPVFHVWGSDELAEADLDAVTGCFAVGISRTENQNPTFLAEQLVEMVARAMSPGVNDPYTAKDCLNRMAAALTVASSYKDGLRTPVLARVSFRDLTFERLFAATFPLCRQYIKPDRLVLDHAVRLLNDLSDTVRPADQACLKQEIALLFSDS